MHFFQMDWRVIIHFFVTLSHLLNKKNCVSVCITEKLKKPVTKNRSKLKNII